mmetsp:Transcript_36374/g.102760  ORF Transcript_36374/g.102760 Transcript_36374/m.102760 type:complete len:162 (-) Transcript_36374:322-807(-)
MSVTSRMVGRPWATVRGRSTSHAPTRTSAPPRLGRGLKVTAGWFENLGKSSDADREAEFQRQQEVLEARRKGKSLDKALARRAKLKKDMEDPVKRAAAWKKVEDSKDGWMQTRRRRAAAEVFSAAYLEGSREPSRANVSTSHDELVCFLWLQSDMAAVPYN